MHQTSPATYPGSIGANDQAVSAAMPALAIPPKPATLLIVDDEEGPRQSLRVIFKEDFNILLASDGPSAIELAQQNKIDVAVLDIRMAGMSGIELLERLKFVDPDIEVVMMTAFETPETMKQALRLRACDYLNKPFDITTIRKAVAMALDRRSLSSELHTNAEKLQQLQKELEQQKMDEQMARARGEIYASIIHDINGPLTIISGLLHFINQRVGDEPQVGGEELELVKDRLTRITRQVTNCIEISRRYLGFLRQSSSENFRVWTNQVLADVGELVRLHPSAMNHQLIIHPLPQDVSVSINGTDLVQILLNLTLNALQSTASQHRVEISGQLLKQPLDLSLFKEGPEDRFINASAFTNIAPLIALTVQDNGPGMAPEVLQRIFEPFFTTQARRSGTGLGLCIVQRLTNQAGGALHVHTRAGQGTVFTVYLPALVGANGAAAK
jgi:two-component system, sensor histidine kinase and response regulator